MKKILLTGGGGFFASRFAEYYKDKYEIYPIRREELDITDENKVIQSLELYKPDYVIHTAAIADTGRCEKNPELSYSINVTGSINVAKGCALTNSRMIYLSSEQIFNGNSESGPYSEIDIPNPNTVYGKHKLEAEEEVKKIHGDVSILRFTWLFGLPERNGKINANIVWNTVQAAMKREKIKVPAFEFRGMTYIYDLLEKFESILKLPADTYHTGSENNLSTYEVSKLILAEMGLGEKANDIIEKDTERYKVSPRDLRITNEKLSNMGIEFLTTEEGIRKCIKDFGFKF